MIDYRNPDYSEVFEQWVSRLQVLRENPELLESAKQHYRTHPWDFVSDWGMAFEPRNIERGWYLISRLCCGISKSNT